MDTGSAVAAAALLAPDEPAAVEHVNPAGRAPVILVCDHASRLVPRSLGRLGLDDAHLARHIAWDIGAADVARGLALRLDAPVLLAGYSRLVIDCNRYPHDPSSIPESSDGVDVPGNRGLGAAGRESRAQALFRPYHAVIAATVDRCLRQGRVPVLISVHSFTPVMAGMARPWHIGVLWDRDGRIARPLLATLARSPGVVVGDNLPYSAREPRGYTVTEHAAKHGYPHVALEIRQDLIATASGAAAWAERLAAALAPVLAEPSLARIEPPPV